MAAAGAVFPPLSLLTSALRCLGSIIDTQSDSIGHTRIAQTTASQVQENFAVQATQIRLEKHVLDLTSAGTGSDMSRDIQR